MSTEKDVEQDLMIRQNAESIRRNEEAIRRQTEALEKIRDHYFPKRSPLMRTVGFFLKVVGAVTVAAGILESADWYWNTRLTEKMAAQSAAAARRLFFRENDTTGAAKFLEKAVELDGGTVRYRVALAYVKGMVAIADLFDAGRPLTSDERKRVDAILAEAVFLQEVAPDEPMAYVLAAQAYGLRGDRETAWKAARHAIELAPANAQVRVTACATLYSAGDVAAARQQLAEAERADPKFPLLWYWKAVFAAIADHDTKTALSHLDDLLRRTPRLAMAYVLRAKILLRGPSPDLQAVRDTLAKALELAPEMSRPSVLMSETYEREGKLPLARLWLDRALQRDATCMAALLARARVNGRAGDWRSSVDDLTAAIALDPLRAGLYGERAKARSATGDAAGSDSDRKLSEALTKETSRESK